jgi:sulfur relay (sulfurtransferase) DsrC/TusE family protein
MIILKKKPNFKKLLQEHLNDLFKQAPEKVENALVILLDEALCNVVPKIASSEIENFRDTQLKAIAANLTKALKIAIQKKEFTIGKFLKTFFQKHSLENQIIRAIAKLISPSVQITLYKIPTTI